MSLMRFSFVLLTYYFISLLNLSKFLQSFKVLLFTIETVFLTNIVSKAYTGFYDLKMGFGKRPNITRNEF